MILDLLLNIANLLPEVRFAPGMVTSDIQIESVDVGEGRNGNPTADNKECQWPPKGGGKRAEKKIEELANPGVLKTIWNAWNARNCTSLVDAEEDKERK